MARTRAAMQGREDAATALSARDAWRLATAGGARCLGRDDCGTLAAGKCADVAFFRLDDLAHAGMDDPLAALALAPPSRADAVVVNDISRADIGFDTPDNEVTILTVAGPDRHVPIGPKAQVASAIVDTVEALRADGVGGAAEAS